MKRLLILCASTVFLLGMSTAAMALYDASITYDYVDNGAFNYTFTFTVENTSTDTDTGALDFFGIDFDADSDWSAYSNVTFENGLGWITNAYEYAVTGLNLEFPAGVNADDADVFGGVGGIAQGDSLSGFEVSFDYTGSLNPDEQLFSWYANFGTNRDENGILIDCDPNSDEDDYWIQGEAFGSAQYSGGGPDPVPEPTTMVLFGTGILGLMALGRKKLLK